jgi:hypothetical protein
MSLVLSHLRQVPDSLLLIVLILILFSPGHSAADLEGLNLSEQDILSPSIPLHHATALILVYLVGSDLESGGSDSSPGNLGTSSLEMMIQGLENSDKTDVSLVVAYGGSNKPGWEGMTIVSDEQLIRDGEDGIFGNEEIGLFLDPHADMGQPESLSRFLSFVSERYTAEKTYLVFSDHGAGFDGFGYDEHTGSLLSLTDITSAFDDAGFSGDMVIFDACLMGGIEVAQKMAHYATYLVASEELIPDAGLAYDLWIPVLSSDPSEDPAIVGTAIVDSYITTGGPEGKTLSVIYLPALHGVLEKLDSFGFLLNNTTGQLPNPGQVVKEYDKTTRFGENFGIPELSRVDLELLVKNLNDGFPDVKETGDEVTDALSSALVYERHDELISDATGLSIADPMQLSSDEIIEKREVLSLAPGWDAFILHHIHQMEEEHSFDNRSGSEIASARTEDPERYAWMSIGYYQYRPETDSYLKLGTLPVDRVFGYEPTGNGTYILPEWDGTWYFLQDTKKPDNTALVELSYLDTSSGDISKYSSQVDLIRNRSVYRALMYSYYDKSSDWSKFSLFPILRSAEGISITQRSGFTPKTGDRLKTYASVSVGSDGEVRKEKIGDMMLEGTVRVVEGLLPDGFYASAFLADDGTGEQRVLVYEYIRIADKQVRSM